MPRIPIEERKDLPVIAQAWGFIPSPKNGTRKKVFPKKQSPFPIAQSPFRR